MKNQKIVILGEEKDGNVTADSEWENRGNPLATKWKNTPLRRSDSFTERFWSQVCLERWLRGEVCGPWRQEEGEDVVWRTSGWLSSVISNSGGWGKSYHRYRASLSRNRKEIVPEAWQSHSYGPRLGRRKKTVWTPSPSHNEHWHSASPRHYSVFGKHTMQQCYSFAAVP